MPSAPAKAASTTPALGLDASERRGAMPATPSGRSGHQRRGRHGGSPASRAGSQLATSSSRAAAHPKRRYRGSGGRSSLEGVDRPITEQARDSGDPAQTSGPPPRLRCSRRPTPRRLAPPPRSAARKYPGRPGYELAPERPSDRQQPAVTPRRSPPAATIARRARPRWRQPCRVARATTVAWLRAQEGDRRRGAADENAECRTPAVRRSA